MVFYLFIVILTIVILSLFRKFDFLSVGALSFILYTSPCLFGITSIAGVYDTYINDQTYVLVNAIMLFIVITILCYDKLNASSFDVLDNRASSLRFRLSIRLLSFCSIIALFYTVSDLGIENLMNNKSNINENINGYAYAFSLWSGLVIFTYARLNNIRSLLIVSLLPILMNLFIGSRAYAATVFVIVLVLGWHKVKHLILQKKITLIMSFVGFLGILIYKEIYKAMKVFNFETIFNILINVDTYLKIISLSETQTVFSILNYVIDIDYQLDNNEILARFLSIIPFANKLYFNDDVAIRFSYLVKNYIIDSDYGLASNIWAEAYSIGNYWGVFILLVLWLWFLIFSNKILYKGTVLKKIFLLPIACYVAFYIHRLDIVQVIGAAKQMALVYGVWFSLYFISGAFVKRKIK